MATNKIGRDNSRFKQIVRGKIKKELRKYITKGELIGRKGKNTVSIPLPQIQLPRFRYGSQQRGGVGQGEGELGQPLGKGDQPGSGPEAGDQPGDHILEVDVELEELAKILGEQLELPRIEPKGKKAIASEKDVYTGIHRAGPAPAAGIAFRVRPSSRVRDARTLRRSPSPTPGSPGARTQRALRFQNARRRGESPA